MLKVTAVSQGQRSGRRITHCDSTPWGSDWAAKLNTVGQLGSSSFCLGRTVALMRLTRKPAA